MFNWYIFGYKLVIIMFLLYDFLILINNTMDKKLIVICGLLYDF